MRHRTRSQTFEGLTIVYDDRVLAPRSWTALQSRWAAELAAESDAAVLELHAGVGHIGLAAARQAGRPLTQVDADPVACGFAVENAWRAGMAHCVTVRCGDVEAAVPAGERFSVVLADPPYVPTEDVAAFPGDPPAAIDGGPDGLGPALHCISSLLGRLPARTPVLMQLRGPRQIDQLAARLPAGANARDARCDGPEHGVALIVIDGSSTNVARTGTPLQMTGGG